MADITLQEAIKKDGTSHKQSIKTPGKGHKPTAGQVKARSGAGNTMKKPENPGKKSYEQLLGHFLGDKLYGVVSKELSPDEVMKYADSALKSLTGVLADQATKQAEKVGVYGDDKSGASAFSNALGGYLHEKAQALLKTPAGKKFAQSVSRYTKTHPVEVLTLVLAAAAVAVASNAKLPTVKQSKKLGHGFSLSAEAQLGKVRNIALEAAKLQLAYQKGLVSANVSVKGDKKGVKHQHAEVRYGTKRTWVKTTADIDEKGILTTSLGGGYGITQNLQVSGGVKGKKEKKEPHKIENANATVSYKGKTYNLAGAVDYLPKKDRLKLDLHYQNKGKGKLKDASAYYIRQNKGGKVAETYGGTAKFDVKDLEIAMKGQFQTDSKVSSGSVKLKKGHMYGGASATYDGRLGEAKKYYVYFGFKDEKSFEDYLINYKHERYPDYTMDEFGLKVQHAIRGLVGTAQGRVTLKNHEMSSGSVSGRLAYHVDKNLSVFGGVAQGFGPEKQHGTMPFVGVEVKKVPVWVGYDTNSKSAMVGFSFRF